MNPLEYVLIRQKNMLWKVINSEDFIGARLLLDVLRELWLLNDYGYKIIEAEKLIAELEQKYFEPVEELPF